MTRLLRLSVALLAAASLAAPALAGHTVVRWHDNHAGAVSVTFDDGLYTQTTVGAPALSARGFKGTFFILTNDGWNEWDGYWQSWAAVAGQGHEVSSHTVTHAHLPQLSGTALLDELSLSQDAITFNLPGQPCLTLAYPFGEYNQTVIDATEQYYIAARTVWSPGYLNLYPEDATGDYDPVDFYALGSYSYDYPSLTTFAALSGYLDDAELARGWFIPHIHELETAAAVTLLNQFLDELAVRDLWVDTLATVARYMQERMASALTVVADTPSGITLKLEALLDNTIYNVPLTLRSTVPSSWGGVQVVQGGNTQVVLPVLESGIPVAYYHAVPNGGQITLTPTVVTNAAPVVNAGPDQMIVYPATTAILDGTVTDDGFPVPPGKVTVQWSQTAGPAPAAFTTPAAVDTGVSLPLAGTYTFMLTASDGALSGSDTVTVVFEQPAVTTVEAAVAASNGDAEEAVSGTVTLNSSDLELVYDSYQSAGNQTVGIRFAGLTIPKGAAITNAYIQFTVDETTSMALTLTLRSEAADNALVYAKTSKNISSRGKSAASVAWSPAAWTKVGDATTAQRTPNLAPLVQEVVNRPGWASGNAMAFIVTGSQKRVAVAYDGGKTKAPKLHVEYTGGQPVNLPPLVNAGTDKTIVLPVNSVFLDASVTDDGLPNPPALVSTIWSQVSGPGTAIFDNLNAVDTTVTFPAAGTYVLMLTADDGAALASDQVAVTVEGSQVTSFEVSVAASAADAEEALSGSVYLDSSDLELVYDSYNSAKEQTVGMRFAGVAVPPGAAIVRAWVQFKVDETTSSATALVVRGEAADNAALFTTAKLNVSSRAKTTAQAAWSPVAWTVVGEAGENQRTPDLSAVVQEIVNRPGWQQGNALAVIVTGTGARIAEAYDGDAAGAPRLHVEYSIVPAVGRAGK